MSYAQLFWTPRTESFASSLATKLRLDRGVFSREVFPDGEFGLKIPRQLRRNHAVLLGGTDTPEELLELYVMACGLIDARVEELTVIIPYFSFSTQERRVKPDDVVIAKHIARLLSSIPHAPRGNEFVFMDLHADGIQYYLEGGVRTMQLYAEPVIEKAIHDLELPDFVISTADASRAKWVQSFARRWEKTWASIDKGRKSGEATEVVGVHGDVNGKWVVIFDDMVRKGSSLIGAAQTYLEHGARGCHAICSHGVLPGSALANIQASHCLESLTVTDTHPHARELANNEFLRIAPVGIVVENYLREHLEL